LKFAAAHNDANLASGGGHGTQSNEVRTRLLDGPCDGGDHPGDQTVGGRARFAEQVSIAHSGAGHHLPAATLEGVLKTQQAVRGPNNTFSPRIKRVATDTRGTPLCAQDTLQPNLYMIPPAVDRLTSL